MKIADCDCTKADYVAWYKYRVSFEEKAVRLLVFAILVGAFVSLFGSMSNDFALLAASVLIVASGAGIWCVYSRIRLDGEIRRYAQEREGGKIVVRFAKNGIQVSENQKRFFYPFDRIRKARELPWYLFLWLDEGAYPLMIDKEKIRTVADDTEPYYIAKKLRELSPDYKYVRGNDLTYTGKYSKLIKHR
ncbi:hypothetical protein [Raoultibacter phocaeensis]|uniref:hypothetical protein n=1 Tax=Raoultibacter phocaeensis TaxID=2479841 RepID=UPI00111943E8|nr:hypothetical protein [Raoultibacter phocaeensis]